MQKLLKLAAILALPLAFVGCGDDDDNPMTPVTPQASVNVTHASPDAPGVDLLVDDVRAKQNLAYPASTGYVKINAGTRNVKVNVTGTTTTAIEADLALSENRSYSVFAVDAVASIEAIVIQDDLTAPAAGKAHVRFLHASPDAPAVDITTTTGAIVFGDYIFKEYSAFTPLDAGTYNLQARLAGTSTVVLDLPGIALQAGKIYTVFAKGFVAGAGAQALGLGPLRGRVLGSKCHGSGARRTMRRAKTAAQWDRTLSAQRLCLWRAQPTRLCTGRFSSTDIGRSCGRDSNRTPANTQFSR